MSNCVTSLTLNRQITLGNLLYCLREGQRVGDNVRTIKRNASLIIGNLVNARIHRVYSLKVVSNLNQRVASNINNAVIHSDRNIVRATISNCHSDSRCIGVRWVSN